MWLNNIGNGGFSIDLVNEQNFNEWELIDLLILFPQHTTITLW